MTKDPVCEMPVEEDDANAQMEYNGKKYFFCSPSCKEEFEGNPEEYLKNFFQDDDVTQDAEMEEENLHRDGGEG